MRTPWILALSLALLVPTTVAADESSTIEKLIELGEQDNRVLDTLHHLVNVIGPRLTSSHQDIVACEWARDQFEAYGLSRPQLR